MNPARRLLRPSADSPHLARACEAGPAHSSLSLSLYIYIYTYVCMCMCVYLYIHMCYSTDYSQQASCLLQTGQLSIYLVTATSRLASQASKPVNQGRVRALLF